MTILPAAIKANVGFHLVTLRNNACYYAYKDSANVWWFAQDACHLLDSFSVFEIMEVTAR